MEYFLIWIYEECIMKILTIFSVVYRLFTIIDLIFNEQNFSYSQVCFVKTQHYFTVTNIFFPCLFFPLTFYYKSWWSGKCKELFEFESSCSNKLYKIFFFFHFIFHCGKENANVFFFFSSRKHVSILVLKELWDGICNGGNVKSELCSFFFVKGTENKLFGKSTFPLKW